MSAGPVAVLNSSSATTDNNNKHQQCNNAGMSWLRWLWLNQSDEQLAAAEDAVFGIEPFAQVFHQLYFDRRMVEIDGGYRINTVEVAPPAYKQNKNNGRKQEEDGGDDVPLVMLHGFGGGVGFWVKNLGELGQRHHVYAIDLLGFGRSSRPKWRFKGTTDADLNECEASFVDSIESWRKAVGIDRFVLLGHSMGGYVAALYGLKYPGRLAKLILASPVGMPRGPHFHELEREAQQAAHPTPQDKQEAAEQEEDEKEYKPRGPRGLINKQSYTVRTIEWMWRQGVSAQSVIRFLGPLGARLTRAFVHRRFEPFGNDQNHEVLQEYVYQISAAHGSGEYMINTLFEPFAWAKRPLCDRLGRVQVPTVFIYGAHDWMNPRAAQDLLLQSTNKNLIRVDVLRGAGHQLFIENPQGFNRHILAYMRGVQ
eukprot:TRINITY_DN5800_c0_g1_i2.p1 TRINITY_DN5800_c0_g1~~TRINITY_DN5800_c0_g1_i2.p1  ORF type:complete len:424 (-),score=196.09 TRINITY_DN5800_c0_g1_i2:64-1335(-)